jgi:hypothetical protein
LDSWQGILILLFDKLSKYKRTIETRHKKDTEIKMGT